MSSLLSGLKFVSKDKSKESGGSKRPAPTSTAGQDDETPAAKSSRMEWMMGPIPLLGRPKQPESEQVRSLTLGHDDKCW